MCDAIRAIRERRTDSPGRDAETLHRFEGRELDIVELAVHLLDL
jgi:hypothetical protein